MEETKSESKLVKTCRSGDVTLGIFERCGPNGPYLEPAKPVYRYRNEDGETQFSGYLRDRHCIHASVCYEQAHAFIQEWKARTLPTILGDESNADGGESEERQEPPCRLVA